MGQVQAGTLFLPHRLESRMEEVDKYIIIIKTIPTIPRSVREMSPEFYLYAVYLLDYFEHLHRQRPHDGTHLWHSNQDLKKCSSAERKQLNLQQRLEVVGLLMRLQ